MAKPPLMTTADLGLIEAAVREAEARTTGEIYCVVAEDSSGYREVPLAWGVGVALLAPAILLLAGIHVTVPDFGPKAWTAVQMAQTAEAAARAALIGSLVLQAVLLVLTVVIVSIPAVHRALTPASMKRDRVRRRAREQFAAKNMHLTRERTGVLIFVSFTERMAELVADEGISAHTEPHQWDKAMAALTAGLKHGQPAKGFTDAIGQCADILAARFPAHPGDNPNEIPDAVAVLPRH